MAEELTEWRAKGFFEFTYLSLSYILLFLWNFFRYVVPSAVRACVWCMQTTVKLVVLFFALFILVIGPKIGMPASFHQFIWGLLVRLGCVSSSSVARVGRQGEQSTATESEGAEAADEVARGMTREVTRELVRMGVQNMDVTLASHIITDTVQGVVSEIFWTFVDVLGFGNYFRNVARYKQRLDSTDVQEEEEEEEEIYTEESGRGVWKNSIVIDKKSDESAASFALVLHKAQKGSSNMLVSIQRWWRERKEARQNRRSESQRSKLERKLAKARRQLESAADQIFEAEATLNYTLRLLEEAGANSKFWGQEVKQAEVAYEEWTVKLEERGNSAIHSDGVSLLVHLERAEEWLLEANSEATRAMQTECERTRDREEAGKRLKEAEEEQSSWTKKVEELEKKLEELLGNSARTDRSRERKAHEALDRGGAERREES
uniref:Uncharacterized protein n=1 Tax=Guillardia theta TaxID=55529 RepID=A0A7S4KQG8_GUITH|mmetsp:Transcript_28617/g.92309  ORF Transcript_28617/g.92309 Transcript_28617/m.92309 type:complete len:434 (+) Transcript_28617:86-1387(+)